MDYATAQQKLRDAFRELAVAKQEFLLLGGDIKFSVHRDSLHMAIADGPHMSMPVTIDAEVRRQFQEQHPEHIYKESANASEDSTV